MMDFYEVLSPTVDQLCGAGTFLLQMLVVIVTEWSRGIITASCLRVVPGPSTGHLPPLIRL